MGRPGRVRLVTSVVIALWAWPGTLAIAASPDRDADGLRDAWERRWGTDPGDWDTDGDGLADSAEDRDGDGLSELGEQRFGTSPLLADTDGDGTSDWREDSDRDGRRDGREQDRRPIPSGLEPSLEGAASDVSVAYRNGCHSGGHSRSIHPCVFGDHRGRVRITLFGDSHALQWLPALDRAAKARRWRVTSITKSACPSVDVRYDARGLVADGPSCVAWRRKAIRWIRDHPQDLVIVANSKGYDVIDGRGRRMGEAAADDAWRAGLGRTLDALPDGPRLMVLGDVPAPGRSVPRCLGAHRSDISACQRSRAASSNPGHDAAERRAAVEHGALFRSPAGVVCPYDPCPVVIGSTLLWRDKSHLTATFARRLAPTIRGFVQEALAAQRGSAGLSAAGGPASDARTTRTRARGGPPPRARCPAA